MPFTLSHPAIVLPLAKLPKRYISATGLIVGSMSPDFEYFVLMKNQRVHGHEYMGILYMDLPIALLTTFLFHQLVRNALIMNLPLFLKARLFSYTSFNWISHFKKYWFTILVSVLIGAVSHLGWDAFTHRHSVVTDHFETFKAELDLFGSDVAIYSILQGLSSLFGALFIAYVILALPKDKTVKSTFTYSYWLTLYAITIMILCVRVLQGIDIHNTMMVMLNTMSAAFLSLCLTPKLLSFSLVENKNSAS